MSKGKGSKDDQRPIIIKKIKKSGGGHHGGAWKVAYADFVTAMMAFFLLLWLLNVTTEEQRNAISNYFDPTHPKVSESMSGAGGIMGGTAMSTEGAMTSTMQNISLPQTSGTTTRSFERGESGEEKPEDTATDQQLEQLKAELAQEEEKRFEEAKEELEKKIAENPELAELAKNLMVDITPEGLRIQVVDQEGDPMFPKGSAQMFDKTKKLMNAVSEVVKSMPNNVSVRGHTDSFKYRDGATYTNWELSADRANATRRVLMDDGIPEPRLSDVVGKADTDHLFKDNPQDARNRRISIILLREDLNKVAVQELEKRGVKMDKPPATDPTKDINQKPVGTFKRTPGEVYFP